MNKGILIFYFNKACMKFSNRIGFNADSTDWTVSILDLL